MRFFRRSKALLALFGLAFLPFAAHSQQSAPQQSAGIRVNVDRVDVGVTVTDSSGRFLEGLHRDDFHIFDNGVEQPITDFATVDEPAQVLVLIEAGPAVYFLQSGHLKASYALLSGLAAGDRVAIVKYAEAPQALLDFTPDKQAAAAAFASMSFNLGFGALNLSSSLSKVLDWLAKVQGKKTIVLLSTGVDTSPFNESTLLLQELKTEDVRVFAVSLAEELRPVQAGKKKKDLSEKAAFTSQQFEEADQNLKLIAQASGGRAYFARSTKEFNEIYTQIAALVRHEYSLAFAPAVHDGMVHSIELSVGTIPTTGSNPASPAFRVDHRLAYLAPGAQKP